MPMEFHLVLATTNAFPLHVPGVHHDVPNPIQHFYARLSVASRNAPCGLHVLRDRPDAGVDDDGCDA